MLESEISDVREISGPIFRLIRGGHSEISDCLSEFSGSLFLVPFSFLVQMMKLEPAHLGIILDIFLVLLPNTQNHEGHEKCSFNQIGRASCRERV